MRRILTLMLMVSASYTIAQSQATYDVTSGNGNGVRFWSSDQYKIHMGSTSEYKYGPVTDYSIKSNMSNTAGRGWTWGASGSQPVAALNVSGEMRVKGVFRSDLSITAPKLEVLSTAYTKIQLTTHDWSGSHALLFNAYKNVSGNGALITTGNTSYANDKGPYSGGAGAIFFHGNGGSMDFVISPAATGKDQPINWGGSKMRIKRDGNVGIGSNNPSHRLEVIGSTGLKLSTIATTSDSWMTIKPSISVTNLNPGATTAAAQITSRDKGHLVIDIKANDMNDSFAVRVDSDFDGSMDIIPFIVKANGKVGVGTTKPDEKFTVKGKIHSEEVRVDLSVPGPDYVFESDYNLRTLAQTEEYIKANKHLPEIPSAKEMEANGVELGEMNMLLLKKIEELTLHLIEKDRQFELLQERLKRLEKDHGN